MTPFTFARAALHVSLVSAIAVSSAVLLSLVWPVASPNHILLFAHHGDLSAWPENSIEGLSAAAEVGLDGLEIDVVRSADGTWWLMHDDTVDRTTNGTGRVAELSDKQLRRLEIDGGIGFDPSRHDGLVLHTLEEAIELLGHEVAIMIDVKSRDADAHADVARILRDVGVTDAYLLCGSVAGASAAKSVDGRLKTLFPAPITWHADIDYYLVFAPWDVGWPHVPYGDFFGEVATFTDDEFKGDEATVLSSARRWGVTLAIVNDAMAALKWRDGAEGSSP